MTGHSTSGSGAVIGGGARAGAGAGVAVGCTYSDAACGGSEKSKLASATALAEDTGGAANAVRSTGWLVGATAGATAGAAEKSSPPLDMAKKSSRGGDENCPEAFS